MSNSHMTLLKFKVTNFRSVRDSGWIEANDVTALIGTNESGKTNLLIPLWKLNPAKEGEIKLIADAPRKDFNAYRQLKRKPIFITARFKLSPQIAQQIAAMTGSPLASVQEAEVSRDLGGTHYVGFPSAQPRRAIDRPEIEKTVLDARAEIDAITPADESDSALKTKLLASVDSVIESLKNQPDLIGSKELEHIASILAASAPSNTPVQPIPGQPVPGQQLPASHTAQSAIAARFSQLSKLLLRRSTELGKPGPNDFEDARKLVIGKLPSFVYYSTYGNLDAEIYLPHVIEDLKRTDLTSRAEARARTLRVLFSFVGLKPEEILELGKDHNEQTARATDQQVKEFAEKKKERSVLLQSASTMLTKEFRAWWKQGEYRFRFEADGNHLRIWVSDDRRPEEIELEGRSTGLQWFLSFYLIFLVESKAAHNGAILLLDEPGPSLHPLAQEDLAIFFESLAESNQLLYTTHSPFLVDADHLDRVRSVYVDDDGYTVASADLRASEAASQARSVYPVHAALGLSVSETLFQGCSPVIVEGVSDQIYVERHQNTSGRPRENQEYA